MTSLLSAAVASLRGVEREVLWDTLEWLAMPLFILYPQLAFIRCYRYG